MEQDSSTVVTSTVPDNEEDVGVSSVQEDDGNEAGPSAEKEDDKKKAVSSVEQEKSNIEEELTEKQVDDMQEANTQEVGNTHEAGNSADKSVELESCGTNNSKALKMKKKIVKRKVVKRKVVKRSPASSTLKTKEALGGQEDGEKEKEVSAAEEVTKTPEAGNSAGKHSKSESPTKKNDKVLKVKKKIVKKSPPSSLLKINKVQSSPKENNKRKLQENGERGEKNLDDSEKLNKKEDVKISDEKKLRDDAKKLDEKEDVKINASEIEHNEKNEKDGTSQKETSELKNSFQEQKNITKGDPSNKRKRNEKKKEIDNGEKIKRKDKIEDKLGGLILMCSSKTKPDCFHYKVMGVSAGKKDSVLAIKPGLKLFLYDFDLRLLYGIYEASSSGGMKLEPKAFNGAFPAQVRFNVYKDCFPIPESVFSKAIKENFYQKHKFKAELSIKQVRKLSDLFRPVGIHHPTSAPVRVRTPPRAPIQDKRVHRRVDEVRYQDRKPKGDAREYPLSLDGRDHKAAYPKEATRQRDEASRGLYLTENAYRTYGLRAERRNLDPVLHPTLETSYPKDYDRDYHMRHPETRFRDVASAQREIVRADHVYFNGKDYPVYSIDSKPELSPPRATLASGSERLAYDSYYARQYGSSLTDTHLLPSRREEAYSTRLYAVDTEPVRHAADALSHYNQVHHKKSEPDAMPVSSRYSFAGPSYSYR